MNVYQNMMRTNFNEALLGNETLETPLLQYIVQYLELICALGP